MASFKVCIAASAFLALAACAPQVTMMDVIQHRDEVVKPTPRHGVEPKDVFWDAAGTAAWSFF